MKTKNSIFCKMMIITFIIPFLVFSQPLAKQTAEEQPRTLEVGKILRDSLVRSTIHPYLLELDAAWFIYGIVDQISVDVSIKIVNPNGKTIRSFDGPPRGSELFYFESEDAGVYRIEISPFKEETGLYSIELKTLEAIATDPGKRIDQLVVPYTGENKPGAAIAVIKNDKTLFSKAYGMASLTFSIPFSTETLNNIGSTSKQFTAFAILLLEKRGKLCIDDDVRDYIPELPDFGQTVTLRHLMTHTSGYREFLNLIALEGRNLGEGDYIGKDEVIRVVQNQPELQNAPGTEWNYNNTGYSLLSRVVERITEKPFAEWMTETVFKPLQMTNTVIRTNPWQIVPNSAQGYMTTKDHSYRIGRDLSASTGAGGIYTTVGDLAKWIRNLSTAKVGGKDIIKKMTTRCVLTGGDTTNYGLGLFIDKHRGLKRIYHGGADIAHRSMLVYYPEIDAAVITQSNFASFPVNDVTWKTAEAFWGDAMQPKNKRKSQAKKSEPFNPDNYNAEHFDEFAGRYELEEMPGFILSFSREGDIFYTQATGQSKTEIVPTSDSTFKLLVVEAGITFHRNSENQIVSLTLHQNGDHPAKRLQEEQWKPSQDELSAYTGRYFSEELQTVYTIALKDSHLVVQHRRMDDLEMTPVKKDTFSGDYPIAELAFMRDDKGEIIAFTVSNIRTRSVQFTRFKK
ncbi:serine hydrolase [candidate division KSB1 bacterium]|nr:serine hydrolase [candidate division KSB1 bacterium]